MKCFVDTSAWYAYFSSKDQFHYQAREFMRKKPELITSNLVLSEILGIIQRRVNTQSVIDTGRFLLDENIVQLVYVSKDQILQTWRKLEKLHHKTLSFVDYSNKIVMEDKGLKTIFAFDEDFVRLGLVVVP